MARAVALAALVGAVFVGVLLGAAGAGSEVSRWVLTAPGELLSR